MRLLRMTHHHWVVVSAARITQRAVRLPPRTDLRAVSPRLTRALLAEAACGSGWRRPRGRRLARLDWLHPGRGLRLAEQRPNPSLRPIDHSSRLLQVCLNKIVLAAWLVAQTSEGVELFTRRSLHWSGGCSPHWRPLRPDPARLPPRYRVSGHMHICPAEKPSPRRAGFPRPAISASSS